MRSRSLTFEGATGATLRARLDLPVDERPTACALFAHCLACARESRAADDISRALTGAGIAVLRFDFTGLDEGEGDAADASVASNVDDLVEAAGSLASIREAPRLLVGHSLGGAAVLRAAERIPSAVAVATIGAPADAGPVRRLLADAAGEAEARGARGVVLAGRRFTIRKAFLDDLDATRMRAAVADLGRALLVFHSPVDGVVGIDDAARIYAAASHPKSFVALDRANHLLTNGRDARYVGRVLAAWARRCLDVPDPEETDARRAGDGVLARTGADGYRTELDVGGHTLISDEPLKAGGTNAGPTPPDLLLASLAACTSMTLRMYADRKDWPLEEVVTRASRQRVERRDGGDAREPLRGRIDCEIELLGPLDAAQRARMLEIARRCPVHRTLDAGVDVDTRLAERPKGGG